MSGVSLVKATVLDHAALAQVAVDQGKVTPCPICGLSSIVSAYDRTMLVCALNDTVTLDPCPTHLCVPPAPAVERTRRLAPNLVASIAGEVVDTWS